jgi:protein-L-isoaspartate O-methyltransferase
MKRPADLSLQRRWYADEVRWNAKLQSERLATAFATVPREAFLGRANAQDASLIAQPPKQRVLEEPSAVPRLSSCKP